MNLENLRTNYSKLISYLEMEHYSERYITKFNSEINHILRSENSKSWSSYRDIYREYESRSKSYHYLRHKRSIIGAIEQFDLNGKFPDGQSRNMLVQNSSYHLLNDEYKSFINLYCEVENLTDKKPATIHNESQNASAFLLSLQTQGIMKLNAITEEAVLAFFISANGELIRGCSYRKNITAVIKACSSKHPEATSKILAYLPMLREHRKTIQYLTTEEFNQIRNTLNSKDSQLSLRDKAIGLLILHTGLRGCDVASMTLSSIDWERDLIMIVQSKTHVSLELPLLTVVGNAIYDYLVSERPKLDNLYVFLSHNRPFNRLKNESIGTIASRIMNVANVRTLKNDRRGFHIFRHFLATSLLENDVPQPVISRTLGHQSPNSLSPYLSADFVHLKECSLSIEMFPINKEVFLNE